MEQEMTIQLNHLIGLIAISFYIGLLVSFAIQALGRATWNSNWAKRRRLKRNMIERIA